MRRIVPRYSANNFPNILKIVNVLRTVGQRHNVTAAQVALAWVMAQGDDIIPIPGTSNVQVSIAVPLGVMLLAHHYGI